jgi:hypothetical protein
MAERTAIAAASEASCKQVEEVLPSSSPPEEEETLQEMIDRLMGIEVSDSLRMKRRAETRAQEVRKREALQERMRSTWYYLSEDKQTKVTQLLTRSPWLTDFEVIMALSTPRNQPSG